MPRALRRVIFIVFVILFFASAVILLFAASGYRYHAGKRVVEKTGKLIVETEPKGAHIRINGGAVDAPVTPVTLSYLLSGEYELTIEKDGFFPIRKTITITPGVSTLLNDVVLIKQSAPERIASFDRVLASIKVGDVLLIRDEHTISSFDIRLNTIAVLFKSAAPIQGLHVSTTGTRMVIETKTGWHLLDEKKEVANHLSLKQKVLQFRFSDGSNDLFAGTREGIYHNAPGKRTFEPIINESDIRSFFVAGDTLFFLSSDYTLREYRISSREVVRTVSPFSPLDHIVGSSHGRLTFKGSDRSMYLFDLSVQKNTFLQVSNADQLTFVARDRFFSSNEFELWEHALAETRSTRRLVTRQSTPIAFFVPFQSRPFIIIGSQDGGFHLRSLVPGEDYEFILAQFDFIALAFLDEDDTILTVVGSYQGKEGMYRIPLIVEETLFPLVK